MAGGRGRLPGDAAVSVTALVRRRGSTATHYRGTENRNTDGSKGAMTWASVTSDVRVLLEPVTDVLAQKLWGGSRVIRDRGFVAGDAGVRPGDALVVTAGRRAGTVFRVEEVAEYDHGSRQAHLELALVTTTETVP